MCGPVCGVRGAEPLQSKHWAQDKVLVGTEPMLMGGALPSPEAPLKGNLFREFVFSAAFFLNLFAF